jgi:hypothetical protein
MRMKHDTFYTKGTVMKKIIGLLGGVLCVVISPELVRSGDTRVQAHGGQPVDLADRAGILDAVQKRLEDQRFAFPHEIQFNDNDGAKNKQFKAAYDAIREDLDRTLDIGVPASDAAESTGAAAGASVGTPPAVSGPVVPNESQEHMKRLRNEIAARDFIRRAEEHYKVLGDVKAIKSKRTEFAGYNPVQIPLAIAEKWTGVYGRNKDIIDSGTKLMVIGSALAFMFNKFGGSAYVNNKIRELFDKPTIYTIRRRKTGFFGSKPTDNLVKPEDLILPMSTRKQVNELMFLINRRYEMSKTSKRKLPLPHVLLYGPPGTGKTTIAQMIADNTIGDDGQPMKLISLMASDFMQIKTEGDRLAVLKKMFTEAIQMRNTIIFLDEIDSLLKQRGGPNESSNRACVDMILFYTVKLSSDYMVIGGTNHLRDMDEAALSRFRRKIGIPLPSLRNRKLILDKYIKDMLIAKSYISQLDSTAIASTMVGSSGRDLESFVTRLRDRIDFENGNTATEALANIILSEMGYVEGKPTETEAFDVDDELALK